MAVFIDVTPSTPHDCIQQQLNKIGFNGSYYDYTLHNLLMHALNNMKLTFIYSEEDQEIQLHSVNNNLVVLDKNVLLVNGKIIHEQEPE